MDASENVWSSGSQHTKPPQSKNGWSSKTFFQIILTAWNMDKAAFKYVPQTAATNIVFSSVCFFFIGVDMEGI